MSVKVGLISDTHGLLRPQALATLQGCDYLIHGGDIGKPDILEALKAFDAGRCFEAAEVQARTGGGGGLEVDVLGIDLRGGDGGGRQHEGRRGVIRMGAVDHQQAKAGKQVLVH